MYVALTPGVEPGGDNSTVLLEGGNEVQPDADGVVESEQFPGLHLHVKSMLAGDLAAVFARLRGAGA